MSDIEFTTLWETIAAIARMAMVIDVEDVQKLLRTAELVDAVGPIMMPSEWVKGRDNLRDQETLARGFLEFRKAIDEVKQNHAEGRS